MAKKDNATAKDSSMTDRIAPMPHPKELVGQCDVTGVRVICVTQAYYRRVDGVVESCGMTSDGTPDLNWKRNDNPPAKAISMLGPV